MKKCFTINPNRTIDEIRNYHQLFEKGIYQGIEIFYPYNHNEERKELFTLGIKEIMAKYKDVEILMHLPHGVNANLCDLNNYKNIISLMKESMDYAAMFKIKKLTLHLGMIGNREREIYLEHIKEVLRELLDYANKYEMIIMIENMPSARELGYSPNEILSLINELNYSNLKFILDTGHANVSEYPLNEYIDILGDYLIHLHFNDNNGLKDEHARLGQGNIDFYKFLKLLKEINYSELYCLEILFNSVDDLIQNAIDLNKYDS